MSTNAVAIHIHQSVAEAPVWREMTRVEAVELSEIHIVRHGTTEGRSTVDIVMIDRDGIRCVAMTTGRIMRLIADAIGVEE